MRFRVPLQILTLQEVLCRRLITVLQLKTRRLTGVLHADIIQANEEEKEKSRQCTLA